MDTTICSRCGAGNPDGMAFCSNCGAQLAGMPGASAYNGQEPYAGAGAYPAQVADAAAPQTRYPAVAQIAEQPSADAYGAGWTEGDAQEPAPDAGTRALAAAGYFSSIIGAVIMFAISHRGAGNSYTAAHAGNVVILALASILAGVIGAVIPGGMPIAAIASIAVLVLSIMGAVKAAHGEAWRMFGLEIVKSGR